VAFGVSLVVCWRTHATRGWIFSTVLGLATTTAWLAPARYAPVQRGLDRLTDALLAGLTWLVLGLVYFGLFTPLRFLRSWRGRDPLQLRRDPTASSFLQPIAPRAEGHFDRQF
jgi:hypothetical protein